MLECSQVSLNMIASGSGESMMIAVLSFLCLILWQFILSNRMPSLITLELVFFFWRSWYTLLYGWLYLSPITRHDENTTDTVSNVKNILITAFRCKPTWLVILWLCYAILVSAMGPYLIIVNKQDGGRMWQMCKNRFSSNNTSSRSWRRLLSVTGPLYARLVPP